MREEIGADASRALPLLGEHDFTFLIEDPATIWNLGPQRYPQIAARYQPLTPRQNKLAIDINVVERYQDVYPTKQQTGTELFELVHQASAVFPRVALYFENSIARIDWPLLAAAASTVDHAEFEGNKLVVHASRSAGVRWSGPALVDGHLWPIANGETVWIPAGTHTLEAGSDSPTHRLLDFNGDLTSASASADSVQARSSQQRPLLGCHRTRATAGGDRWRRSASAHGRKHSHSAARPASRYPSVASKLYATIDGQCNRPKSRLRKQRRVAGSPISLQGKKRRARLASAAGRWMAWMSSFTVSPFPPCSASGASRERRRER